MGHEKQLPDRWTISYDQLKFHIRPTNFKHTGLFPEQAANWRWMMDKIASAGRPVSVLNLFAYTGGATVAAASAGAQVVHVDAAKGMVQWAKENAALSGLADRPIRYITDDVFKFVQREQRRGTNTMRSLWTLRLMAADQVEKRGSLSKACIPSSKAA